MSDRPDGTDLIVEVKDWQREPARDAVRRFVHVKEALASRLERKTAFLFYSESDLGEEATTLLVDAGILILDVEKLASYEMPSAGL